MIYHHACILDQGINAWSAEKLLNSLGFIFPTLGCTTGKEMHSFLPPATARTTRTEAHIIKDKAHWTHLIGTSTTDFQCFKLTTSFGEQYIEEQYWTSSSALAGHMRDTVPCGAQRWYDVGDGQHEQWEGIRTLHCVSAEKLEMLDSVACTCGIQAWS